MSTDKPPEQDNTKDTRKVNVGRQLQKKRRELKLSIQEVSDQIRLRPEVIKALEASQFAEMSEPVYTRGFLRTYANYLGLGGQELVKILEAQQELPTDRKMSLPAPVEEGALPRRTILFVCLAVLLLIGFVWQGVSWLSPETDNALPQQARPVPAAENETDPQALPEDTASQSDTVMPAAPFKTPAALEAEETSDEAATLKVIPPKPEGARIRLYARENVWVEVTAPDQALPLVSRVLEAGESYWVPKGQGITLDVGLPPALDVYIDAERQGISGIIDRRVWNLRMDPEYLKKTYFGQGLNLTSNITRGENKGDSAKNDATDTDEGGGVEAVVIKDKELKINKVQEQVTDGTPPNGIR